MPAGGVQVLVDPVVRPQPLPLAGVARQHGQFLLLLGRDVDHRRRLHFDPQRVDPVHRVAVVQVRDARPWLEREGGDVRRAVPERGRPRQQARLLVVEVVVPGGVREHQRRRDPSEQVRRQADRLLVVHHQQVALPEAVVRRPDQGGRRPGLARADRADVPRRLGHRPAVPRGGRRDMHLPPRLGEPHERPPAKDLGVVGVGEEGEGDAVHDDRVEAVRILRTLLYGFGRWRAPVVRAVVTVVVTGGDHAGKSVSRGLFPQCV